MKKKSLCETVCRILGLYKNPVFIEEYLKESDVKHALSLSAVAALIEIWMIVRQIVRRGGHFDSAAAFWQKTGGYWIFLCASTCISIYSVLYLKGKLTALKKWSRLIIFLYFLLGLSFGILTSLSDISKGRMITCFFTMILMVSNITIWRPIISMLFTIVPAIAFVFIVKRFSASERALPLNEAELINYTTFIITLCVLEISIYSRRRSEAHKAMMLEEARKRESEMYREEQMNTQILLTQTAEALVSAIEAKDSYTHGHSTRVAEYSKMIALKSGMGVKESREVYFAALLHDVGKIGIPNSIINKKGKLTEEEFAVITAHTVIGTEILSKITQSPHIGDGAHFHHERYDGKGYPDGLNGEEIPEVARIIAVADAYDAMTSKRSYHETLSQDYVRSEIAKGAGSQFDPQFARIMLDMIDADTDYTMKENV